MEATGALVLVVDDDRSVREALSSLVRSAGLACDTFVSIGDMLGVTPPETPACLVVDVNLPDGSGLDVPAELRRIGVEIPVVFITGHGTIPMSVRAMKDGAVEFLTKPFRDVELLEAIHQALDRDRSSRCARAEQQALRDRFARLTPREQDVFARIVAGRMNKEIAADLGVVEQTIKQHRGRVMAKLGVRSVADLVRFAERLSSP